MRSENNKIVEEGIKKIEEGNVVKKDSLLSLTILIDFFQIAVYLTLFVLNGISCLILLLAIISRVFNQLILVKLYFKVLPWGFSCRANLYSTLGLWTCIITWLTVRETLKLQKFFISSRQNGENSSVIVRQNWNWEFLSPLCVYVRVFCLYIWLLELNKKT